MESINVPMFRAKEVNSDEYVMGFLVKSEVDSDYLIRVFGDYCFIDPTTLAINFSDMTDSHGNRIFASLSSDGKGGDTLYCRGVEYKIKICKNGIWEIYSNNEDCRDLYPYLKQLKVVGIQE